MPIAPPAVRAESLTKVYGSGETSVTALDAVSTQLESGEFTAIMGPSGSGKSTLLHLLAGLDQASYGRSWVGDVEITGLDDKRLTKVRRDHIGFIFQSFNLVPTLNARENILLPQRLAGRRPDQEWFDEVVSTLGLTERLTHRPSELSGGQQQRVAVARALVMRPTVIFADEPTGALDSAASADVLGVLRRAVNMYGQTVVMVTHDASAARACDRVVRLADGRIVADER
ncbi:ABC transporter ATP-binding protein [Propioniciclava flava]